MISGHYADQMSRAVTTQNKRLKNCRNILAQLLGNVRGGEIVLIDLVGDKFVGNLRSLEQTRRGCLLNLMYCHNSIFLKKKKNQHAKK